MVVDVAESKDFYDLQVRVRVLEAKYDNLKALAKQVYDMMFAEVVEV